MPPRLELRGITKRYGAFVASDSVSLAVAAGEIHAVLSENGAGKSTLMKIVSGELQPDAGEVWIDGARVAIARPAQARTLGVAMVHQHFALFDTLTVAENVALGLDAGATPSQVAGRIGSLGARYGVPVDPRRRVHTLSVGERQRVEILRALLARPRLLILDEPTSVLAPQSIDALFDTLRRLAADGVSCLFISHKLDETRRLATRCTVLRAGRVVAVVDPREVSLSELARLMIGTEPPRIADHSTPPGVARLVVRGLRLNPLDEESSAVAGAATDAVTDTAADAATSAATDAAGDAEIDAASDAEIRSETDTTGTTSVPIAFEVRAGEIVGIAGVSGNGQSALMAALAGEAVTNPHAVVLDGVPIGHRSPRARRGLGVRYVPAERIRHGAVPELSLTDNAALTGDAFFSGHGLRRSAMRRYALRVIDAFAVRSRGPASRAGSLSGGNLQKFIVGREVESAPRVLIVDQPTWGVDVGAAVRIRNALIALRNAGCSIVVVSEDVDELYEIADRLMVMARGQLSPAVAPRQLPLERLGRWMGGAWWADIRAETAQAETVQAEAICAETRHAASMHAQRAAAPA